MQTNHKLITIGTILSLYMCSISTSAFSITSQDVGVTGTSGSSNLNSGVLTVNGSGGDITSTADGFHYAYEYLSGDGQITAQITSLTNTDSWTKFGLMIRKDLSAGAANLMFLLRPEEGSTLQYRETANGNTTDAWVHSTSTDISDYADRDIRYFKVGKWLRLTKDGSLMTSYTSDDGLCWIKRREQNISALNGGAYFGIALTSHNFGVLAQGEVENLEITSQIEDINENCPRAAKDGLVSEANIDYNNLYRSDAVVATGYDLIADYFHDYAAEHQMPGGQLAVMADNNSYSNCSLDLSQNYGTAGTMVVSTSVGWQDKQVINPVYASTKFRLASVDKMVTGAIIAEIFKQGLFDLGYNRQLTVVTGSGTEQKDLDELSFGDIPVLSYLKDYLEVNLDPYPDMQNFAQLTDQITIDHLLSHSSGVREWGPTQPQEDKDQINGITFDFDHKKLFMMEKAAFDYDISMDEWQPIHLARWIFSHDLSGQPGTSGGYNSNGYFLLRYIADEILKKHNSSLLEFMQDDMNLPNMFITNEKLANRVSNETGYFLHVGQDEFLDNRPFLDHYFAIGSNAEQLARYFENYMVSYQWDSISDSFIVDSGGIPGQSPGAFATAKHNKCHHDTLVKHSIAVLSNKAEAYDAVAEHVARALYNHPNCSWGSNNADAWAYSTDFLMRANGNLLTYLGIEGGEVVTRFDNNNQVASDWQFSYVDGEYVRISNGNLFLHAEYNDGNGDPIVEADLYSATNPSGAGLGSWWTAQWKLELAEDGINYRIRNRMHSSLYLEAVRADDDFSDGPGQVALAILAAGGENILWSLCE